MQSVRGGLAFLRAHLEMPFPTDDVDVRSAGNDAPTRSKGQAIPASPSDLEAMGRMARSSNMVVAFVGLASIVIVRGGIRFEHSRRSRLLEVDASGAWFQCDKGKSREGGRPAPPFKFFVPEVSIKSGPFPHGCVGRYCSLLKKLFSENPPFILPGFAPACASLASATGFSPKPMSLHVFNTALWQTSAFKTGKDDNLRPPFTSYSLRRLGPTIADTALLMLHERLPFGNWKGEGLSKADREAARKARMPLLYADSSSKMEVEVAVKTAVWSQVDRLNILAANQDVDSVTWPSLAPRMRHAINRWRLDTGDLKKWEFELPTASPPLVLRDAEVEDSRPPDTSTEPPPLDSSSASCSSGTEWEDIEPPAAIECAEWIHGPLPHHRVHFQLVDGTLPSCARDVVPDPDGFGVGLVELHATGRTVCMTCCRRLGTTLEALEAQLLASNSSAQRSP